MANGTPGFREALLSRCDLLSVSAGTAIYRAGDQPGGLYGLVEGRVDVHLPQRSDAPTLAHIVGPGFWTGEFAAITNKPRLLAFIARSNTTILRLPRAELLRLAAIVPECWQAVAGLAVLNNAITLDIIDMLKRENTIERIAAVLLLLAREVPDDPPLIDVSQTELGQLARMSRGTVNTALRRLAGQGLIVREYGAIQVPDLAALEAFALAD